MAEIARLENRHDIIFLCRGWSDLHKISETGAEWHVDCCDVVEIETKCRIPIWRTFGRIHWHVISEPRITLQGTASWWIPCHDSRATCHVAGCKNSIRHIENRFSPYFIFLFLMQFRLWRAAAFVSSPIHLLIFTRGLLFLGHCTSVPLNHQIKCQYFGGMTNIFGAACAPPDPGTPSTNAFPSLTSFRCVMLTVGRCGCGWGCGCWLRSERCGETDD